MRHLTRLSSEQKEPHMQITKAMPSQGFPAAIKVDFESQAEFDLFSSLFNCAPITEALDAVFQAQQSVSSQHSIGYVYDQLDALGGGIHLHTKAIADAFMKTNWARGELIKMGVSR
jgi:hypothetical protein